MTDASDTTTPAAEPVSLTPDQRREVRLSVLKAMAEGNRLSILEELLEAGELDVSTLCERVGIEMTGISHHLRCLRNCGLVTHRQDGKHRYYRLNGEDRVAQMLDLLGEHADDAEEGALRCEVVHDEEDGG